MEWENIDTETDRARVPGGWLVRSWQPSILFSRTDPSDRSVTSGLAESRSFRIHGEYGESRMTKTKTELTCATCPWWRPIASENSGRCHHSASAVDTYRADDWWCNEHPDRKLPDVHELAKIAWPEILRDHDDGHEAARRAYREADAMLAEAKRRRGE